MKEELRVNKVWKFFIYVFVLSWGLWSFTVYHTQVGEVPGFLLLLGMFASLVPSIVGVIFIVKEKKFKDLFNKFKLDYKIVGIFLLMPLIGYVSYVVGGDFSTRLFEKGILDSIISFFVILFIGGAIGEEFGWRGFALLKLKNKFGYLYTTLILGVIWSLWHLPLFFMEGTVQSNLPMWQFMLQNTLIAFLYTYLYVKTNGNVIMMILFHAISNHASYLFPFFVTTLGRFTNFGLIAVVVLATFIVDKNWYKNGLE